MNKKCLKMIGCLAAGSLVYVGLAVPSVQAQEIAGETVRVQPNATLRSQQGRITLQVGTDVRMGDVVRTNRGGEAQLLFTDDTKLVVGPNSSLVIESYLLRSRNRANSFAVKALSGSFRMITGRSDKSAYTITTPSATIGVRGTTLEIGVWGGGAARRTDLLVPEGTAIICDEFNQCLTVTENCSVVRAQRFRPLRVLEDDDEIVEAIVEHLPYLADDDHLDPRFQVRPRGCSPDLLSRVRLATQERGQRSPVHDRDTHNNDEGGIEPDPPERERTEEYDTPSPG